MCERAQKSTEHVCALAQSVPARFRALQWAMATQPKSKAVEEYRRQIALYLEAVMVARQWKLVRTGEAAGGLKHTTISRALKRENTLSYPALLALAEASGVPIPESLTSAARTAQQPTRPAEEAELARRIAQVAKDLTEPERQALLRSLQESLVKAR